MHILGANDDSEQEEKGVEGEEESGREVAEVGETMELSINSIFGLINLKTMKIKGQIGQQEMMSWWVAGQLITSFQWSW